MPSCSSATCSKSTSVAAHTTVFDVEVLDDRPGLIIFRIPESTLFAHESGGHRYQRVSPTERRGRVHSSTVTVAVLSEPQAVAFEVRECDLQWTTRRGTGPGGQHRNKTESAVDLRHTPSGLVVRCQSERSQKRNKDSALAVLRARLYQRHQDEVHGVRADARRQQVGSGQRGDKRRTVRMQADEVIDHMTGQRWRYKDYERGNW